MVVDDEPMVGRVIARILGRDHDVTVLSKAHDALRLIASGERWDVIFCDLMMPEMTGMELHERLRLLDVEAAARVIFVTGGVFTPEARAFLEAVPNLRVEKPFNAQLLRTIVAERMCGAEQQ